ncbi:hypothetical protein GKZ68_20730 (plasmid) [Hymenobacter sp. BRD128]|uniref:DUF5712 family protein n=1 Tax=Hymenobacter sp. BRD128 TaxID=2675878 RepID=UPI0015649839|nr:DUF5712 family protein [Hymenobacter sp. BRD128]QKG59110.1 hypothetical protein GKZ68_20730 [Hymenobacter sp. BRD128]
MYAIQRQNSMHSKIINPQTHGKNVYQNTGSAARTLNYLVQESKGQDKEASFFGAATDALTADQVRVSIDTNVKGLKETDVKFYSLVLSPSEAELARIGNDEGKLKDFTRQAMEQYAANFKLKDGRELASKDLVWAATIHHSRSYRGDDPQVQAGEKKEGEKKEGYQTHVHILVSARDAQQKLTLNPQGQKRRFNMQDWQGQVQETFDKSFGKGEEQQAPTGRGKMPTPIATAAQQAKREAKLTARVGHINSLLGSSNRLDPEQVVEIARKREFDKSFYRNLSFVARRAADGRPVEKPHQYLQTGQLEKPLVATRQFKAVLQVVNSANKNIPQRSHVQEIGEERKRGEREY